MTHPIAPAGSQAPHARVRLDGRDPHERVRAASPLELLFDLTFVVAFAAAGTQMAHLLAEAHWGAALASFAVSMFAVIWAWINYSWFASAFDTDDWQYRITTMVQMVGVLVLAVGLPSFFASVDEGHDVANETMVLGYIIMRLAQISQWLRAAHACTGSRRRACLTYAICLALAQLGWAVVAVADLDLRTFVIASTPLFALELAGPAVAERRFGGTPWHAHHIAERYGLLTIITLGEVITGTVVALSASVESHGWSLEAGLVALAGASLCFGLWWVYFALPMGETLHHHRDRSFGWGYGHMLLFAGLAACGAGLHVAALALEGESHLSPAAAVACLAVPAVGVLTAIVVIYSVLTRRHDRLHTVMVASAVALGAIAIGLAQSGVALPWCLLVVAAVPWAAVIGYELVGHRHVAEVLRAR